MRVLLVEDDPDLADALHDALVAEGFSVDVAGDGLDGLWRAREGQFSVIILDILLPGMNGYQVCKTLRAESRWTPIMMLTAKGGEFDIADGLDVGADDYLTKPFSLVELMARLRALARRGSEPRPALLVVGDLELDPATHRCRRGSTEISLTPREQALLEVLLRAAPDVVRRQAVLDAVWGIDFAGDPSVLDVYIGYLRKKVDRPFGAESIRNVRGVGYRVVDPRDRSPG